MSSSRNSADRRADASPEPILVRDGGASAHLQPAGDPVTAWIELMEVIEALCPRWPERTHVIHGAEFRL
jgi:hypothetical protein